MASARRFGFWLAALPLAALVVATIAGRGGLLELLRLRRERTVREAELFRSLGENDRLRQQVIALRRSDRDLERIARRELGLVRQGEIVYRFRTRPERSAESR